jgi:hypothetical protein
MRLRITPSFKSWCGYFTVVLLALPSLYVIGTTLQTVWSIKFPSLYLDQWDNLAACMTESAQGRFWRWLFSLHNEHQLVIPRLLFLADAAFFGASNRMLYVWILLNQIAFLWIFYRMMGSMEWRGWKRFACLLALCIPLFSSTQLENFSWGFQVQFVNVYLFAFISFWLMSAHLLKPDPWRLAAAIASGVAASYSMSNGLLVWPLLILGCLFFRAPKSSLVWVLVVFTLVLAGYLSGARTPGPGPAPSISETLSGASFYQYVMIYLANPLGKKSFTLATWMSAGSLITLFSLILMAWKQAAWRRENLTLITTCLFIGGSATFTSLGRSRYGLLQATAERYTTPSLIFLCCIALLCLIALRTPSIRRVWKLIPMLWVLSFCVFFAYLIDRQWIYTLHYKNKDAKKHIALNAIQLGTFDPHYSGHLHPNLKGHIPTLRAIRKDPLHGPTHHWNPPSWPVAKTHPPLVAAQTHCMPINSLESSEKGWILYGGIALDPARIKGRLLIHNQKQEAVGSGYLVPEFEPVWPLSTYMKPAGWSSFYVHLKPAPIEAQYVLLLEDQQQWIPVALLGTESLIQPSVYDPKPLNWESLKRVSFHVEEQDEAWTENGAYPTSPALPEPREIFGSWSGNDAWVGSIRIQIDPDPEGGTLVIPYISGPIVPNASMELIEADTHRAIAALRPGPSHENWSAIKVNIAPASGPLMLIVHEEGSAWGQWIGIAAPMWQP